MSGFLRRAYEKRERVISGLSAEELFGQDVAVRPGYNGRYITPELAMNLATVNRCVRVLSDGVAQLPLMLYRPNSQGAREQATNHPLWTILHDRPNRLMSPFAFKQTIFRSRCSCAATRMGRSSGRRATRRRCGRCAART